MKLWIKPLAFLLVACSLAGCRSSGVSALKSITVTVLELKAGADAQSATVTVRYFNASTIPIGLSATDHRIQINGIDLGRAISERPVGLAPSGSATETLPVEMSRGAVLPTGQAIYHLSTLITVMAGSERMRERIESSGVVEISAP